MATLAEDQIPDESGHSGHGNEKQTVDEDRRKLQALAENFGQKWVAAQVKVDPRTLRRWFSPTRNGLRPANRTRIRQVYAAHRENLARLVDPTGAVALETSVRSVEDAIERVSGVKTSADIVRATAALLPVPLTCPHLSETEHGLIVLDVAQLALGLGPSFGGRVYETVAGRVAELRHRGATDGSQEARYLAACAATVAGRRHMVEAAGKRRAVDRRKHLAKAACAFRSVTFDRPAAALSLPENPQMWAAEEFPATCYAGPRVGLFTPSRHFGRTYRYSMWANILLVMEDVDAGELADAARCLRIAKSEFASWRQCVAPAKTDLHRLVDAEWQTHLLAAEFLTKTSDLERKAVRRQGELALAEFGRVARGAGAFGQVSALCIEAFGFRNDRPASVADSLTRALDECGATAMTEDADDLLLLPPFRLIPVGSPEPVGEVGARILSSRPQDARRGRRGAAPATALGAILTRAAWVLGLPHLSPSPQPPTGPPDPLPLRFAPPANIVGAQTGAPNHKGGAADTAFDLALINSVNLKSWGRSAAPLQSAWRRAS